MRFRLLNAPAFGDAPTGKMQLTSHATQEADGAAR